MAAKKDISLDLLIFGIGDMRLGARSETPCEPGRMETQPAPGPAVERLSQFVHWRYVNRMQDAMIWLERQSKRAVSECEEWLANPAIATSWLD